MACVLTSLVLVLLCVVILAGTRQALCASVYDDDEKRLLMDLFDKYAPEIRPVSKKSDNVTIKFGLSLHQIIAVDFKNQIVKSSVWIRQTWYNPYLSWNSSLYGGIKTINVEPSKVWVPDIYLYNNADDSYDGAMDKFKTKVVLYSDGNALWLAPKIISSSCQFDVTYFPFDEQLCILKFGSWTYNGFSLNFINEDFPKTCEGDISKFIMNGEWNLMEMPCQRNEIMYVCCPAPYPDVTYTLHLRRKFLFYFINMIAPCFLISALTLLSFYLPPESGERLTLVITNLLALTVFMLLVVEMIPATSETVPLISIYFYGSVFEVALALIATCLVLRCYFNPSHKPVPSWVRHVVLSWMARLTRVNVKKIKEDARKGNDSKHGSTLELSDAAIRRKEFCARASGSHELDSVTRLNTSSSQGEVSFSRMNRPVRSMSGPLGEISAGISAVTRDDVDMRRNLLSRRMHEPVDCSPLSSRASSFVNIKNECHRHPSAPSKSPLGESLEASILQSNRTLTSSVGELVEFARDQQEMDRQLEEWRMVAIVVDKFFLWVFLLILFVSSIVIFMQAPRYVFGGRH